MSNVFAARGLQNSRVMGSALSLVVALAALIAGGWTEALEAGGTAPAERSAQGFLETHSPPARETLRSSDSGTPTIPKVWCADITDEPTRAVCWQAYRASLSYYETGLNHRTRVFRWQHLSTRIIFFVVIGLVLAGMYFAWVQFRRDMATDQQTGAASREEHEIELSTSGFKVRSSVLGVIILALSLGFFYLYLVYVFPISEIF